MFTRTGQPIRISIAQSKQQALTVAGYLSPVVVEQIARGAGVTQWWIGKANREDLTWPVAALRQNAQEVGLLRNAKGTLAPTARARAVADRPRELVASVLERLPLGKGFEAQAGWFLLLGLAAGESGQTLDTGVAQMLTDLGWSTHSSSGLSASDARRGATDVKSAFLSKKSRLRLALFCVSCVLTAKIN